jgi:hypothetical protein
MGFLSDLIDNPVGALTGTTAATRQVDRSTTQANRRLDAALSAGLGYLTPYEKAGRTSLADLLAGLAPGGRLRFDPAAVDVTRDPGYRFRLDQGNQAIERSAAARGTALSGQTLRALQDYAQGLASQEYGNAYDRALGQNDLAYTRLSDLVRLGYGAGGNLLDARLRAAGAQAGNLVDAGQFAGRATQLGFAQAQDMARTLLPALLG